MLELHCIFILWTTAIQPTRSVCQIIQAYIFLLNLSLRSTNSRLNTTIHPRLSLTSYPNGWDWKQQLKVYIIVNHHGWKTYGYNQMQNRPGFSGFCRCHYIPIHVKSDNSALSDKIRHCFRIFVKPSSHWALLQPHIWHQWGIGPQILCWI